MTCKVLDNFLPEFSFKKIEDICINSSGFPWFLTETAYPEDGMLNNKEVSFANTMYYEDRPNVTYATISNILATSLDLKGFDIKDKIERMRFALQVPLPTKVEKVNNPHIDAIYPHKVLLLYLNNSDGDTIIYNEMYDFSNEEGELIRTDKSAVTESFRVTPKRNRAIIFDGGHWHSSSTPTNTANRIVLNCNFN